MLRSFVVDVGNKLDIWWNVYRVLSLLLVSSTRSIHNCGHHWPSRWRINHSCRSRNFFTGPLWSNANCHLSSIRTFSAAFVGPTMFQAKWVMRANVDAWYVDMAETVREICHTCSTSMGHY